MKVVLDTNVLISGLINPEGTPAQVVNLLLNSRITILYDNRILEEYREVLKRKKFGFTEGLISPLLNYIKNEGEYVAAEPISAHTFIDKDDQAFFEVAVTGKARCIVTRNKDHYPAGKTIMSPKEFIVLYLAESDQERSGAK